MFPPTPTDMNVSVGVRSTSAIALEQDCGVQYCHRPLLLNSKNRLYLEDEFPRENIKNNVCMLKEFSDVLWNISGVG